MRLSSSAVLALPLLAAAQGPFEQFEQYKAQFQNFLSGFGAKAPTEAPSAKTNPVQAAEAAIGATQVDVLTLSNWKDVLYGPVKADQTTPTEWWVLISGGNKTCFGHCDKVEKAFNASAARFSLLPKAPHMALINCDDQPVLCNSWSASSGTVWSIDMVPPPAPVEIYRKRMNLTSTTDQTFVDLYNKGDKEGWTYHDGYFHPFNGPLAKNGLSVPIGYFFYVFNAIPSWAMMLVVSFFSRSMMNRRMGVNNQGGRAPAAAPRGAPPGDAR
ncbi:Peptidyl-tRNA hydrolase [Coniochaeta hoffmannii]|uniref:Peptidyl-tRNA hydrolase n=1 Tax=Coniochaeta hoffmannii TaxID=91930 RepID=A0AA38W3X2_9PEZI|nr:Peptidyl-tRNA hydrolase [Coniochaeta hoffmannii]